MADKHSGALWAAGGALIAAGGIFMAVTGFEPAAKPTTVWANSWFDLGLAFVILGLAITTAGVIVHFRREAVQPRSASPAVSAADGTPGSTSPVIDPDLATRAEALSGELYEFLDRRQRLDPIVDWPPRSPASSEEERHLQFTDFSRRKREFDQETMSRYDQHYSARALAIFDEAVEAGLAEQEDRWRFKHPTNWLGIRDMAQRLGTIASQAAAR